VKYLVIAILWILQIALVVLFLDSGYIRDNLALEQDYVRQYLGEGTAVQLQNKSLRLYNQLFIDTKVAESSYKHFLPEENVAQHGMENLAPWFFKWMKAKLDAWWWLTYGAVFRLYSIGVWLIPLGPLVLAAFIDGVVSRKIHRDNFQYANPIRYKFAGRGMFVLLYLPFVFLAIPVAVPPILIPIWIVVICMVILMLTMNAQHRI
jgi:Domain of unknown function (DUF4400)